MGRAPEEQGGFLGSGWQQEEPDWAQGGQPRRWRKAAWLSGVSVLAAIGITFAGVRLVAHPTALTIEPPAKTCSSDCPGGASRPGAATDSALTVDPTSSASASEASPTPTTSAELAPTPGQKASPSPTATKQRTRAAAVTTPTPTPRSASPSRTRDAEVTDPPPDQTPADEPLAEPDNQGDDGTAGIASPHVTVEFTVLSETADGYAARLVIHNDATDTLSGATIEIPLSGQVTDVNALDWTQRDDGTLVITPDDIEADGTVTIRFRALGPASTPGSCTLSTGVCVIG